MQENSRAAETLKRRRERRIAALVAVGFVLSTVLQALLTGRRQTYGFLQSLLYFGLLHLNLILVLLLVFLVSRNLIRAYLFRRSGTLGSSLRWRMVTAMLGFSLLPSILLFTASSTIIRTGFDKWFGTQVARALDDAQAIVNVHYGGLERNLEFFTDRIRTDLQKEERAPRQKDLDEERERFPVEAVEIYFDLLNPPIRSLRPELPEWMVPRAALESLTRAFQGESFHLIRQYGDGDLVQRFAHLKVAGRPAILVLSQSVPLGLKTRISDLQSAFSDYQKTRLFKDDLKARYSLFLLSVFLVTVFGASWFGIYLAKNFTEPISELLSGTEAFRQGRWDYRIPTAQPAVAGRLKDGTLQGAEADLEVLKSAFNLMAEEVGRRGRQLEETNTRLVSVVRELEERERYLETLLSSIRRGVLVIDNGGYLSRINQEALVFADVNHRKMDPVAALGQHWRDIFSDFGEDDAARAWLDEAASKRGEPIDRIFEVGSEAGRASSLRSVRATGIQLRDDRSQAFGWLVILEDVADAARLERLAAWQEVARRVAHEIKNPLTPIQLSVDRLYRRMSARMQDDAVDGPVFLESVRQIQKQVRVIRDLVREFSEFSKLPEPKLMTLRLADLIEEVLKDYRFTRSEYRFEFESKGDASDLLVRADPEAMRRLLVNIADNAAHSLETAKTKEPTFFITMERSESEGFLKLTFEDNGPGISASMREKIFDPYVTSKTTGTGLGLAIVRRIAIEHSGRIRCEEAPGGRFVLELPFLPMGDSPVV